MIMYHSIINNNRVYFFFLKSTEGHKYQNEAPRTFRKLSFSIFCVMNNIAEYHAPVSLKDEYYDMNYCFSGILASFIEEASKRKLLQKIKVHLVSIGPEIGDEVQKVNDEIALTSFLRRHCFLSNYGILKYLVENLKLKDSKKNLEMLTEKRKKFYSRILAEDFAMQAIEDHKAMKNHHEEVI